MKNILLSIFIIIIAHSAFAETTQQNGLISHSTWILDYIHPVSDFPKAGIQFQWYAHLLRDPKAFSRAISEFAKRYRNSKVEVIAGLDSRGFIFGAALAYELKLPFIMIRKLGKLPGDVERIDYQLEYGLNSFEIEKESVQRGQKVLVVDDVLATGGTASAACTLIERLGGEVVEVACLIEISSLNGRKNVSCPVFSLLSIEEKK